jgi:hypothetical protein
MQERQQQQQQRQTQGAQAAAVPSLHLQQQRGIRACKWNKWQQRSSVDHAVAAALAGWQAVQLAAAAVRRRQHRQAVQLAVVLLALAVVLLALAVVLLALAVVLLALAVVLLALAVLQ